MKKFRPKQLKINQQGVEKVLGDLESKVMRALWKKETATVREVCDYLAKQNKKKLSFNTVMTIMNRLLEKELLSRQMKGGSYHYTPLQTEEAFLESVSSNVMESILRDPNFFSAASFLDLMEEVDPDLLKELRRLVKKKTTDQ